MRAWGLVLAAVLLVGCDRRPQMMKHSLATFDVEPEPAPAAAPAMRGARIAYSHAVTYAFGRRTVAQVQGRQLALCRRLGPARCTVVKSSLNAPGPDDHIVTDEAVLLVAASLAGEVNARLDALAVAGGARVAHREAEAEDVTRQVIDADAAVRAKQALVQRLLAIIRSGRGNVGELVQAERAYAQTQGELDAAQGERAALAQRVAMSRVTISYAFDDTPGRGSPIAGSLAAAGDTLASSVATLVTAVVALVPWLVVLGLLLAALRWVRHRRGWRWPRRALPNRQGEAN